MYCKKCGKELREDEKFCPACGASVDGDLANIVPAVDADSGSFGWAVLGFCIPLVGLILFLVWKSEKPASSKKAGVGALVGFIVYVILMFVIIISSVALAASLN